jgi:PKD repeat protein
VVRAAGSDAVVAVIEANVTSGPAPLAVSFSGRKSSSEDDTIRDYFWDFDDLTTSRSAEPRHVFVLPGTYIVKLRVVTAGGVEASTQTMISVSGGSGSLQFAGDDVATLPIATTAALTGLTFEAWFLASGVGGSVFSLEPGGFSLAVLPGSNLIRITVNGNSTDISAVNLGGQWHYLAVTYGQPTGVTVYLDGFAAAPVAATGAVQTSLVSLGEGFNGRIAEVRLWSGARTAVQIAADAVMAPTGSEAGLLGAWNLNEGSGQSLRNLVGGAAGTLGTSDSAETSDPTWSTDGPRGP